MRKTSSAGFTLIEVMVALAVFAIGAISLSLASSSAANNARRMEEQTLARWVAKNEIVEIRLADTLPPREEKSKTVEYAGREWLLKIKATPALPAELLVANPGLDAVNTKFLQVEIGVYLKQNPDQRLDLYVTYMGKV